MIRTKWTVDGFYNFNIYMTHIHFSKQVMGTEVNMAARLCGKAPTGSIYCSEKIYEDTKLHVSFDMSKPLLLKGRDGEQRALSPVAKKVGMVRRQVDAEISNIFCGRKEEMIKLHAAVAALQNEKKGGAFILEGLAGIGKSAIVQQLQRDAEDMGVRFLLGSGFAIEKEVSNTHFQIFVLAFAQDRPV